MTASEACRHIQYTSWASRKLLEAAKAIPVEDLTRHTGVSHASILGTLGHTYWADRVWFMRVADPSIGLPENREVVSLEALERDWNDLLNRWQAWADALSDADLDRVVAFKMLNGTPTEMPLIAILIHVVNHATLHRGQAMAMIRQLGIAPPATDYLFFYRETG